MTDTMKFTKRAIVILIALVVSMAFTLPIDTAVAAAATKAKVPTVKVTIAKAKAKGGVSVKVALPGAKVRKVNKKVTVNLSADQTAAKIVISKKSKKISAKLRSLKTSKWPKKYSKKSRTTVTVRVSQGKSKTLAVKVKRKGYKARIVYLKVKRDKASPVVAVPAPLPAPAPAPTAPPAPIDEIKYFRFDVEGGHIVSYDKPMGEGVGGGGQGFAPGTTIVVQADTPEVSEWVFCWALHAPAEYAISDIYSRTTTVVTGAGGGSVVASYIKE